ncbi:inositol monophosphatase family protein [Candidatus Darwinibacter acetoxidans]|nr:inositol monophosphatase family protein [Bacillota bacterium]
MIEAVKEIALAAGEILMEKLLTGVSVQAKGSIDLVTDADQASEAFVVRELRKRFPEHGILAEEGARREGAGEYLWVIDPLDGTTNFAHGFPYFCVSIGLVQGDETVLAVVYDPVRRECFAAEKGSGAYLNGRRLTVSKTDTVHRSLLATGFPYDIATTSRNNLEAFSRVNKASQGVRSLGAAALDLCQVAAGRLDAFWELSLRPWDLAAGSLMVQEAQGTVTGCAGEKFSPLGHDVCASNGFIHEELLQLIKL